MSNYLKPLISIIIPAYNAEGTIEESLASVEDQTLWNGVSTNIWIKDECLNADNRIAYEIIVIDDCSTDNTMERVNDWAVNSGWIEQDVKDKFIKKYKRNVILNSEKGDSYIAHLLLVKIDENKGPAFARNTGIARSNGEWIAFLDADDIWLDYRLKIQFRLINIYPDAGMWSGHTVLFNDKSKKIDTTVSSPDTFDNAELMKLAGNTPLNNFAVSNPIATSTVLIKKDVLEKAGLFDERFHGPEDYDLWMRVAECDTVYVIDLPLSRYRKISTSLSMSHEKFLSQVLMVIDKAYSPNGVFHNNMNSKNKAKAYQYLCAAWSASDCGESCCALKLFTYSLFICPYRFLDPRMHKYNRLKLFLHIMRNGINPIVKLSHDVLALFRLPYVKINLMYSKAMNNAPFYQQLVMDFYKNTEKRHPKAPLFRRFEVGMAICELPGNSDDYFRMIKASARRNYKKAKRNHYRFSRIKYNNYLEDITDIRRSAKLRQGEMPDEFFRKELNSCHDPVSKTNIHDYPYFGILIEDKLVAFAGCFISGEICMIEQLYGHSDYHADGIVPMLIIDIAEYIIKQYPRVKYYAYGLFFGAAPTMRRFKKKFHFMPHRVKWILG